MCIRDRKNGRKLKLFALSSLYECTDLELKLQRLMCIVAANFIKISEKVAQTSHLTIILNCSIHHLEFFSNWTFEQFIYSRQLICIIMQSFIEIGQKSAKYRKRLNISLVWHENGYLRFFSLFWGKKWEEIETFCVFIPLWIHWPGMKVAVANMHRGRKFYQNQWKNCWNIAFDNFFKLQHSLSWIFFYIWLLNDCYDLDS